MTDETRATRSSPSSTGVSDDSSLQSPSTLFLLAFATLFLELALIRYLSGNVWNLGYFPNLVLLAAFMGMGVGFVFHSFFGPVASNRLFGAVGLLLLALVLGVLIIRPNLPGFGQADGIVGGELYFTAVFAQAVNSGLPAFIYWFGLVVIIFAGISQRTAKAFACFSPLKAYTIDIAGSCAGILAFMFMSWQSIGPPVWFGIAGVLLIVTAQHRRPLPRALLALPFCGVIAVAVIQDNSLSAHPSFSGPKLTAWSPYQKVEVVEFAPGHHKVFVNGLNHQETLSRERLVASFYAKPYEARRANNRATRRVLVIGAGTGNDVAAALLSGATHVDAVEIDPSIANVGRQLHPLRPYGDPRVKLTIDDGRAFMTRTRDSYDLIVFALTDSLVKASSMAQLRLENYLFTADSMTRAFELLRPNGQLVLYNYYRRTWFIDKLQRTFQYAIGQPAEVLWKKKDFIVFAATKEPVPYAASAVEGDGSDVAVDDWPFPYLQSRGIPTLYLVSMAAVVAIIALLMLLLDRLQKATQDHRTAPFAIKLAFVLMGVAFLLLETKSIVQFSLLFGTTWINNSLVFLAILLLVLAANWAASTLNDSRWVPIAGVLLVATALLPLAIPLSSLLKLDVAARLAWGSLLTFSPIFFANLIFSLLFRKQAVPEHVFGWNLIGATLGGVLEYLSMAVGYANLALLVASLYAAVVLLFLRSSPATNPRT